MGNQSGTRRRARNFESKYGESQVDAVSTAMEAMRDDKTGAYDKLVAWMVEMAENDDENINPACFVEHLTHLCSSESMRNGDDSIRQNSVESSGSSRYSQKARSKDDLSSPLPRTKRILRQRSCDSALSTRINRSKYADDILDPRTRFRRAMLSRQATLDYSDGEGPTEQSCNTSVESLCNSSSEHDSDTETNDPRSVLLGNYGETSFTKTDVLKQKRNSTRPQVLSTSVGDLLDKPNAVKFNLRRKSRSMLTMRRMKSETRCDDVITPISEEQVANVLDDNLLDRNISDILFSLEALWPSRMK